MIFLNLIKKLITIFAIGATLYSAVEILWRGFTHWTMAIAGGLCMCGIYSINDNVCKNNKLGKYTLCSLLITAVELIIGIIVNIFLKMNVWDYSSKKYNILGQICPLYTFYWFLLSIPAVYLSNMIKNYLFENIEK